MVWQGFDTQPLPRSLVAGGTAQNASAASHNGKKTYHVRTASLNETQATTQPGHNVACGAHGDRGKIDISMAFLAA